MGWGKEKRFTIKLIESTEGKRRVCVRARLMKVSYLKVENAILEVSRGDECVIA